MIRKCGWEDDEVQNEDIGFSGGANKLSLEDYRKAFEKNGKLVHTINGKKINRIIEGNEPDLQVM